MNHISRHHTFCLLLSNIVITSLNFIEDDFCMYVNASKAANFIKKIIDSLIIDNFYASFTYFNHKNIKQNC